MTGFDSKREAAADKLQEPWNEDEWRRNNWRCGHGWLRGEQCEICNAAQPAQEPSATRPCRSCGGTGERWTGIDEAPTSICKPCNGTGQIAPPLPAQEPVREALKLALEALEDLPGFRADIDNAITAIKEALAQPAQKPHGYDWSMLEAAQEFLREHMARIKELEAQLAQPMQKPVAYVTGMSFGRFIVEPLNPAMVLPIGMALYFSPQGKKT